MKDIASFHETKSSSILETVIRYLPVGLSITDAKTGRALFYNQTADELVERKVSQRQSLADYATYGAIHPDGTPYKAEEYPTSRVVKSGLPIFNEEMLYRRSDGSISTFSVSSVPVRDAEGHVDVVVTTTFDLTPRRKLESELHQSQHELEEYIRLSPVPMVVYRGPNHLYAFANPAHQKLVGRDVTGKTVHDLLLTTRADEVTRLLDEVYRTGKPVELKEETYFLQSENEERRRLVTNLSFFPLHNKDQKITGILGVAQDITDQVLAREAAETHSKWLEALFDHLPVPLNMINPQTGELFFLNKAAKDLPFEIPLKPDSNLFFSTDETGQRIAEKNLPRHRISRGEDLKNFEFIWRTPHGSFPVSVSGQLMPAMFGRPAVALATIQDLTEQKKTEESLKESEARFKKIFESNLIGILFGDSEGRLYDANDYYSNLIGYTREEVIAQKVRWDMVTPPEDLQKDEEAIEQMRRSESGACRPYQKRYLRRDGKTVWVELAVQFIDEERKRTLAYVIDISARKLTEDQLQQTLSQLQNALVSRDEEKQLRERFVVSLSHDLRTPLSAAKMSSELLKDDLDPKTEAFELADMIGRNVDRADQMIRDLLDANRINAGETLPILIEECDLTRIAQETLDDLKLIYGGRFVLHSPGSIQGYWSCQSLRRIFENLCSNAIKYGDPEGPVTVSIGHFGPRVEIQVHNEGPPIPAKDQASLFEMFRRTETAIRSRQKGWGIGLMLVKGMTEAHGGTVSVASAIDRGTTFIVTLPIDARPK